MSTSKDVKDKYRQSPKSKNDKPAKNRPLSHLELLASETESDDGNEEEEDDEEEEKGGGSRPPVKYSTEILDNLKRSTNKRSKRDSNNDSAFGFIRCQTDRASSGPRSQLKFQNKSFTRPVPELRPKCDARDDLTELRVDKLLLLKCGREDASRRSRCEDNDRPKSSVETIEGALKAGGRGTVPDQPRIRHLSGLNFPEPEGSAQNGNSPINEDAYRNSNQENRLKTPVRSKSWLLEQDWRGLSSRGGGGFSKSHSDYERALSSLLWQPYECRSETASGLSGRNLDDSDVSYWLNPPANWTGESLSNTSSLSSLSSSSSSASLDTINDTKLKQIYSRLDYICGDHDSTSSSLCGLVNNSPTTPDYRFHGNVQETASSPMVSDLNNVLICLMKSPPGSLLTRRTGSGGCESQQRQSEPNLRVGTFCHGARSDVATKMLVNIEPGGNSDINSSSIASLVDNSCVGIVSAVSNSSAQKTLPLNQSAAVVPSFSSATNFLGQPSGKGVNCYRAIPATVSSVPSILCQNSNNVSNIRITENQCSVVDPSKRITPVNVNSASSVQNIYIPPTTTNSPVYTLTSQNPPNSHPRQPSDPSDQHPAPLSVSLKPNHNVCTLPCNTTNVQNTSTQSTNLANNENTATLSPPAPSNPQNPSQPNSWADTPNNRTFTSTEAQTDDVIVNTRDSSSSDQRRRERRARRHQQRLLMNSLERTSLPPQDTSWHPQTQIPVISESDRLPDILNSHLPPPYSTLPHVGAPTSGQYPINSPPPNVSVLLNSGSTIASPASTQHPQSPPSLTSGFRFPFAIVPNSRRRSRLVGRGSHYTPEEEEEPKSCCGVSLSQTLAIRWFILVVFFLGLCCAVVGSVLGLMRISGRDHLTISILMIGVGILLVAVSVVAWRMTSRDAPSCRVMLGLSAGEEGIGEPNRRFVPRLPPTYGRPHHPYAAMMYPEFQYRAPPPSYQASMQEYRLRLLLLDRNNGPLNTVSPPPTYRSHAGSLLRPQINCRRDQPICHPPNQLDYSRPPSYRSRTSSTRPSCNLDPNAGDGGGSISTTHSRDPSQLSLSDSSGNTVNVITVIGTRSASDTDSENIIKMVPDETALSTSLSLVSNKKNASNTDIVKDSPSNIVTIVQSAPETNGSVIVTVTGTGTTTETTPSHACDTEMQILAHL